VKVARVLVSTPLKFLQLLFGQFDPASDALLG